MTMDCDYGIHCVHQLLVDDQILGNMFFPVKNGLLEM